MLLLFAGHLPGAHLQNPTEMLGSIAGSVIELSLLLLCAWRFWIYRGAILGPICLLLYVVEIVLKITSGTTNIGWILAYLAIGAMIINGIRGAWSFRMVGKGAHEWLSKEDAELVN